MKRNLLTATTLAFAAAACANVEAATVDLSVNLTTSASDTQTDFDTNWATNDNSLPSNLTIDGVTLSVNAAGINNASTLRSINRGDLSYAGTLEKSTETWWGQRASSSGPGGFITIDFAGLTAGTYTFTSWHLDQKDQTGIMKIQISTDDGATFTDATTTFNLTSGGQGATTPVEQSFDFTSTGADVQVRFTNTSVDSAGSSGAFALVNGFTLVPEPSSLALLGLGGLLVARRRRG